jgi:hypothetical protein
MDIFLRCPDCVYWMRGPFPCCARVTGLHLCRPPVLLVQLGATLGTLQVPTWVLVVVVVVVVEEEVLLARSQALCRLGTVRGLALLACWWRVPRPQHRSPLEARPSWSSTLPSTTTPLCTTCGTRNGRLGPLLAQCTCLTAVWRATICTSGSSLLSLLLLDERGMHEPCVDIHFCALLSLVSPQLGLQGTPTPFYGQSVASGRRNRFPVLGVARTAHQVVLVSFPDCHLHLALLCMVSQHQAWMVSVGYVVVVCSTRCVLRGASCVGQ